VKVLALAFACTLAATAAAFADPMASSMPMGSMAPGHMSRPTCPADDPVVGVNPKTNTYMTHDQMKAQMAGMSHDQMHAMMANSHVQLMCKSKADAMGAKPMAASTPAKT
jgi:hypothetical protein